MKQISGQNEDPTGPVKPIGWPLRLIGMPRQLYEWVLSWAEHPKAPYALAFLALFEASVFPVPPDLLLVPMCLAARQRAWRYALICSVASVAGGLLGYGIGAFLWSFVENWFYVYVPGFSPAAFARVQQLYHSVGVPVVFTAGFSPIPYKIFTITSGVMELPLVPFILASAAGRAGRFFLLAALVYRFGPPVRRFLDKHFGWVMMGLAVLLVAGFAVVSLFL